MSPKVAGQRAEILAHLLECRGCSELYDEMKEYYRAIGGPEALPEHAVGKGTALRLNPSYGIPAHSRPQQNKPAVFRWVSRHRKAVASAGTMALVASVMMIFAITSGVTSPVAHHVVFNRTESAVNVSDRTGNILFSLPLPAETSGELEKAHGTYDLIRVEDIDGDKIPEVITTLPYQDREVWRDDYLRVYRSDGSLKWRAELGENLKYAGEEYALRFAAKTFAICRTSVGSPANIIVGASHLHSPYILYRFSPDGENLGQYRLFGHSTVFRRYDADGDGDDELIVGGFIDTGLLERRSYLAMLDPFAIQGTTESTFGAPGGFGSAPSKAEMLAVRLPQVRFRNEGSWSILGVGEAQILPDNEIMVELGAQLNGRSLVWDITFGKGLVPDRVKETDSVREFMLEVREEDPQTYTYIRSIPQRIRGEIEFWNGQAWVDNLAAPPLLMGKLVRPFFNPTGCRVEGRDLVFTNAVSREIGSLILHPLDVRDLKLGDTSDPMNSGKVGFVDIDGDGVREVILARRAPGGGGESHELVCVRTDGMKIVWTKPLTWNISFPQKPEVATPDYLARDVHVGDADGDGKPDVVLLASHISMFPSVVAKLDASTGQETSTYLHIGHLQNLELRDLDRDGSMEILAGGVNNAFKQTVVVVLNARDFGGVSPYQGAYAPAGWRSGNERAYIRIPRSIVGETFWVTGGENNYESMEFFPNSDRFVVWIDDFKESFNDGTIITGAIGLTFTYDLKPVGVSTNSHYDRMAERMYASGDISRPVDLEYLEEFISTVQYWNGHAWHSTAVKLGRPGMPAGADTERGNTKKSGSD